jgi:hypothetical protein
MNKDYLPSTNFEQEDIDRFNIPYYFQDSCVDHYVRYRACQHSSSALGRSTVLSYVLPSQSCGPKYKMWERCQKKRERDIEAKTVFIIREKIASQYQSEEEPRL